MAIEKVSKQQVKSQTGANISQSIAASRSVAASIAKEKAVFNQLASISVYSLNQSLKQKGQDDALIDTAKDEKLKDEYNLSKISLEQEQVSIAALEARGTFLEEEGGDTYVFDNEEDTASYDKLLGSKTQAKHDKLKTKLEDQQLKMNDTTFTAYGKSYQNKSRAIGLNRLMIDLDKESAGLALEYKDDPVAFAQAMTKYRTQIKDSLPEELHAAYDQKALLAQNTYARQINKNVQKQLDEELSASTAERMDLTSLNLLNAATTEDNAGFIEGKKSIKSQLQTLVNSGIISQSKADSAYRSIDTQANTQKIMTDFKRTLSESPLEAQKFLENFTSKTSNEMYGLSQRGLESTKNIPKSNIENPLDIEYNTLERDTMAAQMAQQLKATQTAQKSKNSYMKTSNNKQAQDEIDGIMKGESILNPLTDLVPGVNIEPYILDNLNFARQNAPQLIEFNDLANTTAQQDWLNQLKAQKSKDTNTIKMIEVLDEVVQERIKLNEDNPGSVTQAIAYETDEDMPTFNPGDMREFMTKVNPIMQQQYMQQGLPRKPLTNEQVKQASAYYDNLGPMDKLSWINAMGDIPGVEFLMDQMGENGSEMKVLHNVISSKQANSPIIARIITDGKEKLDLGLRTYTKDDTNDYYQSSLNGRLEYMDPKTQLAYREAVIAYAIGANPEAKDLDSSMIEDAQNAVIGNVDDRWFRGTGMVIYNKSMDQVQTLMDSTTTKQVLQTMPPEARIYSQNMNNPLASRTLAREIAAGKIKMIGTGVTGEYILERNNVPIFTAVQSERKGKNGLVRYEKTVYKFKLWQEGK